MTACRDWKDRLLDLALGAVQPSQARAVEAHVSSCPACAAALTQFCAGAEEIDDALHQLVREGYPPLGFPARLLAATQPFSRPAACHPRGFGRMAEVALLALVAAGILLPTPGKWRPSGSQLAPRPETTLASWRSPTEALLHSPGAELLRSTPRLGEVYFGMESLAKPTGKKQGGKTDES